MIPLFEIKSFTAFNSESNLTVKAFEPGLVLGLVVGVDALAFGLGAASLEQAAARQETHTVANPPVTVVKNFALFICFFFKTKRIKICLKNVINSLKNNYSKISGFSN